MRTIRLAVRSSATANLLCLSQNLVLRWWGVGFWLVGFGVNWWFAYAFCCPKDDPSRSLPLNTFAQMKISWLTHLHFSPIVNKQQIMAKFCFVFVKNNEHASHMQLDCLGVKPWQMWRGCPGRCSAVEWPAGKRCCPAQGTAAARNGHRARTHREAAESVPISKRPQRSKRWEKKMWQLR